VVTGVLLLALLTLAPTGAFAQSATKTVATEFSTSPVAAANATVRGAHTSAVALKLNVDLSVRNDANLKAAITAASTPGGPGYGHYLTPAEYMATYAPTDAQVAAAESWLSEEGLHVTGTSSDNLIVHVKGSTAAVEHAFSVAINDYTAADGRAFYAPDRSPSVRADLAIESVSGLSDYFKAVTDSVCSGECGATGNELRTTYDITSNAEGETIAYTLWGKPLTKETFKAYAEKTATPELKLGAGNEEIEFKEVGGANTETGEEVERSRTEEALDTESAHVVAPKAHHIYFLANENSSAALETTVQEAYKSSANVISNSWAMGGGCPISAPGMEKLLEVATSLGKTFFFSSGDDGAARGCTYPDSSQYAVAVGGTRAEIGPKGEYTKETALKDGGNCNNAVERPSWQTGLGTVFVYPSGTCTGRVTPDVAAISAYSGEESFPQGEDFLEVLYYSEDMFASAFGEGGTSLAAPVWTAGAADWNHENAVEGRPGIGFVDPTLYSVANKPKEYRYDFHDVTEGSNGFTARPGYDEATGWGSPDLSELSHNPSVLKYTGATEGSSNQSVTLSATLDDEEGKGLPSREVHFAVGAESCEAETNSLGVASCGVTIKDARGSYTVSAKFAGDPAYVGKEASTTFAVRAAPPVFGRCLKVTKGSFKNSSCTDKLGTETGKYEWSPGPGPKTGLSVLIKEKTTVKIETTGKHSLICTGASGTGNITGEKTMTLNLTLTGCSDGGEKCSSTGTEGEVRLLGLQGTLGWLSKSLKKVDAVLAGSEFAFAFYECPKKFVVMESSGILMSVSVDKDSINAGTDKMSESKGKQTPNHLEGEEPRLFEEFRATTEGERFEQAGMAATLTQKDEEAYEVNAIVG